MNPFTESTVARPLVESPVACAPASCPVPPSGAKQARRFPVRPRSSFLRRSIVLRRLGLAGAMGVVAGIALAVSGAAYAVDVNAATQEQLEAVRGIGSKTAQIIIQERMRGGQYESFEDLSDRVKGIGPKKAATLQASGLTMGRGGTASPAKSVKSSAGATRQGK